MSSIISRQHVAASPDTPADVPAPAIRPGGAVISRDRARMSHLPAPVGHAAADGPRVDVIRDGSRIVAIYLTCRCGERLTLECDYE